MGAYADRPPPLLVAAISDGAGQKRPSMDLSVGGKENGMSAGLDPTDPGLGDLDPMSLNDSQPGFENVVQFLSRFGYLLSNTEATAVLDNKISAALRRFQAFYGLPQTGEFDDRTREEMQKPRCGLPDPSIAGFSIACAWTDRELTYAFDVGTNDVPGTQEFNAVRSAFRTWQSAVVINFIEVNVDNDPDILVGWGRAADPDLDMTGNVIAHADFPPNCPLLDARLPQPVHFDDEEHRWSIGAVPNAFDIETVALH